MCTGKDIIHSRSCFRMLGTLFLIPVPAPVFKINYVGNFFEQKDCSVDYFLSTGLFFIRNKYIVCLEQVYFTSLFKILRGFEDFKNSTLFSQYFGKLHFPFPFPFPNFGNNICYSRSRSQMLGTEFLIPILVPKCTKVIPADA